MPYHAKRIFRCTLVAPLLWSLALPASAQEQKAQLAEAERLNQQVLQLLEAGQNAEAVPLAKRALALREKALGPEHLLVGTSLNNLALLYQAQGDYGRATPLFQRALAIYEKALGAAFPSLNDLERRLVGHARGGMDRVKYDLLDDLAKFEGAGKGEPANSFPA